MSSDTGYTKFPNVILDWMLARSSDFTKLEIVVLLAVVRNTLGWNREKGLMSCRFIAKATGLDSSNVNKAVKRLEAESVLTVDRSTGTAIISLNLDGVVKSTTGVWLNQPQGCGQINHGGVVKTTTDAWLNQPQTNTERQIKDKTKTPSGLADFLLAD